MKDLKGCLKGLWRMLSLVRGRVLLCAEGLPLAMTLLSAGTSLLEEAL